RIDADGARWALRSYPSGGALYPIDVFVHCRRVRDVSPGLYRFDPRAKSLLPAMPEIDDSRVRHALFDPPLYDATCIVGFLRADMRRMRFKYGERSYRFALIESGHIAQNLLLLASWMGLGSVPLGGF